MKLDLKKVSLVLLLAAGWIVPIRAADPVDTHSEGIHNDKVGLVVSHTDSALVSERLETRPEWADGVALETDAGFLLDIVYTGWHAPGKVHNADTELQLGADDFKLDRLEPGEGPLGADLTLWLSGRETGLEVRVSYLLPDGAFYVRKRIAVRDPKGRNHFLRGIWPVRSALRRSAEVVKPGGFGDPVALAIGGGGAFLGLEYPAGTNGAESAADRVVRVRAGQEIGERIGEDWLESDWAVIGLAPDRHLKRWFERYLDDIRVAPLRPYALYNTWYDVRSPEYTDRAEDVMNEANLLRIVGEFRRVMEERPGFRLDAFVLDDGWDVYASDWVMREAELPGGLRPISRELGKLGVDLGIWFGPTGGYSFRDHRIDWMRDHGYERVGDQMCVAGERYHDLLVRRTEDLVRNHGAKYFKWDGIQFSCSEPDHGHPVGIYSRRAVMDAVIEMCAAVREANRATFLNITSGTWMSPWWLMYANTIWMQGYDYGYSDVPSISKRDRAITYRDVVLHENYGVHDLWFPISGLMTHGIIKGHLQKLGGEAEPLDKFTDNTILYFARGVSMWELYVSPQLLTDDEWDAIAGSMAWARSRFDTLMRTDMIGGDPGGEEPYGYVHFDGPRGIVAARNPFIEKGTLKVALSPAHGLSPDARSLVLERVYPTRWISPKLHAAGATIEIPLEGYETAVFELYPLEEATEPLLAGVVFERREAEDDRVALDVLEAGRGVRLLDPERVRSAAVDGVGMPASRIRIPATPKISAGGDVIAGGEDGSADVSFRIDNPGSRATLAILVRPEEKGAAEDDPEVVVTLNGDATEPRVELQEGTWSWHLLEVEPGRHAARVRVRPAEGRDAWRGTVGAWLILSRRPTAVTVVLESDRTVADRPLPPRPWPAGELRSTVRLGEVKIGGGR